jgi:hypothetical protein
MRACVQLRQLVRISGFLVVFSLAALHHAAAYDRLCDTSYENCRIPLIELIRNEKEGIDVAFWFMEDARYSTELINRFKAGVPVRILVDPRANSTYPLNAPRLEALVDAGIPMRKRTASGILHWKMMSFKGQGMVQFSAANYSPNGFVPVTPYVDYVDEAIYFTDDPSVVQSFFTKFDDLWINTSGYANYVNINGPLTRSHLVFPKDPELNFAPSENFATRSVSHYDAETSQIDVIMYRITDRRHTDALIRARERGVLVRLITEPKQYRDTKYYWHSWNVDRLHTAGIEVRHRKHHGLTHQKSTLLYGQGMTVFGSSNWTSASASSQEEHNYFTGLVWFFQWFQKQFERKWYNQTGSIETTPFIPEAPAKPVNVSPANGSSQSTSVTLSWKPGYWAHKADVYFGTSPTPPRIATDVAVTPNSTATFDITNLTAGRTYYWQIVSKTMANKTKTGDVWSFSN